MAKKLNVATSMVRHTVVTEKDEGRGYHSLRDFSRRVRIGRDDITALCPAGVFARISGGLARTMPAREFLKSTTGARGKSQDELFAPEEYHRNSDTEVLAEVRKKTNPDELWEEYTALGFLRNTHPLALWKNKLAAFKRIKAVWLPRYVGNSVKLIGWPITPKEA